MTGIPPPPKFRADGDEGCTSWRGWKESFMIYLVAKGLDDASDKRKVSLLLHFLGPEGQKLFNTFTFRAAAENMQAESKEDFNTVIEKFDQHYGRGKGRLENRQKFLNRYQHEGESVVTFIAELKHLCHLCEFGDLEESLLVDRIVNGVHDEHVKMRLYDLDAAELNLENCIRVARTSELTQRKLQAEKVHYVNSNTRGRNRGRRFFNTDHRGSSQQQTSCQYCDRSYARGQCPAYDKYCGSCGQKGHYARSRKCQNPKQRQSMQSNYGINRRGRSHPHRSRGGPQQRVYCTDYKYDDTDSCDYVSGNNDNVNDHDTMTDMFENQCDVYACNMDIPDDDDENWNVNLKCQGQNLKLDIDTGAKCNILSSEIAQRFRGTIRDSNLLINGIHTKPMKCIGTMTLSCMYNGITRYLEFKILPQSPNVLSRRDSIAYGLVVRVNNVSNVSLLSKYKDVFEGIRCVPGKYDIRLDDSSQPTIAPPRPVPAAIRDQVKDELDSLEKQEIIIKVSEPTEWISPMVCVRKPSGRIRICIDPFHLNKAIYREHYPMSTVDDVITRVHGSKFFSVLDANMGCFQIPLTDRSSRYTTFNTPFGRYRYLRMPMGITSSPEIYQRVMHELFSDVDGVEIIMDDILIHGKNMQQHNERLQRVLQRAQDVNLKFNPKKAKIAETEVTYVGHRITKDGLKPSADRIKAIVQMREPHNHAELETVLGMVAYVSKFLPHLSQVNSPLRELKISRDWYWRETEKKACQNIKDCLSSDPLLKFYDVKKPLLLSVDASTKGLGATIIQDNGVVAYASRALTPTEQRYAQIEKEMLAVVFGCQKFHKLIYGKNDVTIESDHKPLESLCRKPIHSAPMRIQRMLLKLQPYTYKLVFTKGKLIGLADCLSRLPIIGNQDLGAIDQTLSVCKVDTLAYSQHDELTRHTEKDDELQCVMKQILQGWPDVRSRVPALIMPYWEHRDELGTYDGLVYRGDRVCIPRTLRTTILKTVHRAHLGMVKTKQRARDIVFWPGMSKQIEEMVSKCPVCQEHRNKQPKEPMKPYPIPSLPWSRVACDLFELYGATYLVIVDSYSGYMEFAKLQDMSTTTVITHLKENIARYGIMDTLVSDNGPQFASQEFDKFVKSYKIQHLTSSPHYQQSNGLAEKGVQTVKNLIKKTRESDGDLYLALLDLRNTPRDGVIGSPVQRLMGRRTGTLLPTTEALLQPQSVKPETLQQQLGMYRNKQKQYYDRGSKPLPELKLGDSVRIKTPNGWKPAQYIESHKEPRSHVVKSGDQARLYRRNRTMLLKTNESSHVITPRPTPLLPRLTRTVPPKPPDTNSTPRIVALPEPTVSQQHQMPMMKQIRAGRAVKKPTYLRDYVMS